MKLMNAIAERVTQLRKDEKLSVHGFSLKVGVHNSTLTDIINATYESVQIKYIYAICDGLGITLKEFFDSPLFDRENIVD